MLADSVPHKDPSRFTDGPLLAVSPHGGENSSPRGPVGAWRPHVSSTLTARRPVSQRPLPGGQGLHHRGFGGNTGTQSIAHGHSGRSLTVSGAGFNQIALCGGPLCAAGSPARPETCGRSGAASALCVGLAPAVRSLMYRAVGCDAGRGPADSTTLVTHGEAPQQAAWERPVPGFPRGSRPLGYPMGGPFLCAHERPWTLGPVGSNSLRGGCSPSGRHGHAPEVTGGGGQVRDTVLAPQTQGLLLLVVL